MSQKRAGSHGGEAYGHPFLLVFSSVNCLPYVLQKTQCNYSVKGGLFTSLPSTSDATFLFRAPCAEKSREGHVQFSVAFILVWSYSEVSVLEQCNGRESNSPAGDY